MISLRRSSGLRSRHRFLHHSGQRDKLQGGLNVEPIINPAAILVGLHELDCKKMKIYNAANPCNNKHTATIELNTLRNIILRLAL